MLAPPGVLPQPAERLDPSGPVRPYEFEVAVERLCLDSTSFRKIREPMRAASPTRWPSGSSRSSRRAARCTTRRPTPAGVLLGTVRAGRRAARARPRRSATRIVTLASLTLTPAAPRADHRRSTPARRRSRSTGPPTCASARLGGRCPTTCRSRPRSRSTTSTPPPRTPRPGAPVGGTVCVLGAGHARQAGDGRGAGGDGRRLRGRGRRRPGRGRAGQPARALRHRGRRRPARSARRAVEALRGAGVAAGRPHRLSSSTRPAASRPRSC